MKIRHNALKSDKCGVLLVNDEPKNLRTLTAALDNEFDIQISTSAQDAKTLIKDQGYFDVIISDQIMPEVKGHELLSWCVENFPNSKRIMLTGLPITEELRQELVEVEKVNLLTKPWNIDEIKQSIRDSGCQSQQPESSITIDSQTLIVEASDNYHKRYNQLPEKSCTLRLTLVHSVF